MFPGFDNKGVAVGLGLGSGSQRQGWCAEVWGGLGLPALSRRWPEKMRG